MRFIKGEFFRFILFGGINTLAGYLIYALLLRFFPYLVAYSIMYILVVSGSYVLASKFVFGQKLGLSKAVRYPLVYIVQYLLGIISLYFFVELLNVNKLVAPLLVVMLAVPISFFLSRRIVKGRSID